MAANDTIPVPEARIARFERMAFGMFIHWGLYSQLGRGEWVMHREQIPKEEYAKLKDTFTAADFDGRAIARTAREAGMKYITLTTRHHEGFSLYDTRGLSDFDAPHSPAGRDLIAEFVDGCRAEGIVPFFYHTTLDWRWQSHSCDESAFNEYLDYLHASVEVLCTHYGDIGGLWFDGDWSRRTADWKHDRLYGMIRRLQPEAMIINNTGIGDEGRIGHSLVDSVTFEQSMPKPLDRRGHEKYIAGEMCQTMNSHWGVGGNDFSFKSPANVIENLAGCRKVGANYLLNVGPTAEGAIPAYEAATLATAGRWAQAHERPVYEGKPVAVQCQGRDFLLEADGKLYWFVHDLRIAGHGQVTVSVGGAGPRVASNFKCPIQSVRWMDNGEALSFAQNADQGLATIDFTGYPYGTNMVVRVAEIELGE
ncbi:MAG: alpha-L-fucosidase [Lentisphaeria bacterium]|nr:alpha-L-fucosidase [Lentisphaeria bacterium]